MTTYRLSILTPQGEVFKGPVEFLTAAGELGEVGIMSNHAAMIISLKRGVMKVKSPEGQKFFVHESGVLEVKPTHDVLALVDNALPAANEQEAILKLNNKLE